MTLAASLAFLIQAVTLEVDTDNSVGIQESLQLFARNVRKTLMPCLLCLGARAWGSTKMVDLL